ncbi:MAG: DUF952 domain-containing protein [Thermomicrobiales bacterium]|jgi:uncharacterized protein (DUF952 family)
MAGKREWSADEGPVFHLAPEEDWDRQRHKMTYVPEAYAEDGFIHCTIGTENLIAVGNMFYQSDHRPYVALVVEPDRVESPIRFDDESGIYPHIYGTLPTAAVTTTYRVVRAADGSFMELVRDS